MMSRGGGGSRRSACSTRSREFGSTDRATTKASSSPSLTTARKGQVLLLQIAFVDRIRRHEAHGLVPHPGRHGDERLVVALA